VPGPKEAHNQKMPFYGCPCTVGRAIRTRSVLAMSSAPDIIGQGIIVRIDEKGRQGDGNKGALAQVMPSRLLRFDTFTSGPPFPRPSQQVNASCRFSRHAPSCKGFKISLARCTPVKNFLSFLCRCISAANFYYVSRFLFLSHDWVRSVTSC
jgi:hypothetical protein